MSSEFWESLLRRKHYPRKTMSMTLKTHSNPLVLGRTVMAWAGKGGQVGGLQWSREERSALTLGRARIGPRGIPYSSFPERDGRSWPPGPRKPAPLGMDTHQWPFRPTGSIFLRGSAYKPSHPKQSAVYHPQRPDGGTSRDTPEAIVQTPREALHAPQHWSWCSGTSPEKESDLFKVK